MPSPDVQTARLPPVALPRSYGYVAAFLTLRCNQGCDFCINRFTGPLARADEMSGEQWLAGLNRLVCPADLPITLQGGEPSLHPGFYQIIAGLRRELAIDLLSNLRLDVGRFMRLVPPDRLRRDAPYASIRVSHHPGQVELNSLIQKVLRLQSAGYSVGIWMVDHPAEAAALAAARKACAQAGIDFRVKEFLGRHEGRVYGTYRYPSAVAGARTGPAVLCRTTELLIGPDGSIYRCHSDLYAGRRPIGHLLDPDLAVRSVYRLCDCYGLCSPCDVKIKTNRFQEYGHTSVSIVPVRHRLRRG